MHRTGTKPGYGTRMIPAGAITGIQAVKTPGYLAIGMFLDQTQVNVIANDTGGELDPHGDDQRGNPIGQIMYSNAFTNGQYEQQIHEWHEFIGSGMVCMKICNPGFTDPAGNLCENRFDTVGCEANVPLNYAAINGTFQSCLGDNQQVPNGQVLPIPATSMCTDMASTSIFSALPTFSTAVPSSSVALASSVPVNLAVTASPTPAATSAAAIASPTSSSKGAAAVLSPMGAVASGLGLSAVAGIIAALALLL